MSEAEKEPAIRKIVEQLVARFPAVPRMHIAWIVAEEYDTLDAGRIKIYLPTLVEHRARTRIQREYSAPSFGN